MTALVLGVVDIPYTSEPKKSGAVTTGDVAGWLENKYHPMEHFYEINQGQIAAQLANSVAGALESALMGGPVGGTEPFAAATTSIEASFKAFLSQDVLASLGYPGLPTKAALAGVNLRLKAKKGAPRPSLISTGLYQSSMKAWVE